MLHVTAAKTSDVVKALARHEGDERLEVVLYSRTGVIAVDVPITLDGLTVVTFAAAPGSAVSMQCTSGSKGSRTSSQGPILRLTRCATAHSRTSMHAGSNARMRPPQMLCGQLCAHDNH